MDKNDLIIKIIKLKIPTDYKAYFSKEELLFYCDTLNLEYEDIIKLLQIKFHRTKGMFFSELYMQAKEDYIKNNQDFYIQQVIINNIKNNFSHSFNLNSIDELAKTIQLNSYDLIEKILMCHKYFSLHRGDYKSFNSNYYKIKKEEYFEEIRDNIIEEIIKQKVATCYSKSFSIEEIKEYSKHYNINIRDFLKYILKINEYSKENDVFYSNFYKECKETYLLNLKTSILTDILLNRIKTTNSHGFTIEDLTNLSQKYKINSKDIMVFILGKSSALYHDIKIQRINKMYSQDYYNLKEEYVLKKKEEFSYLFNPNRKTYYTLDEIKDLSIITGININDIIIYFFEKSENNLYNLKKNYFNQQRISYGQYKAIVLPKEYVEKNYNKIREIVKIAVKSVFNYYGVTNYERNNLFEDLVQDGLLYLILHGNPWENDSYMVDLNDIEYKDEHFQILFTKCFYSMLTTLKKMIHPEINCCYNEDIFKKIGIYDEIKDYDYDETEQEKFLSFIDDISYDEISKKILIYFSENSFSKNSVKELSEILNITEKDILVCLKNIRENIENNKNILLKKHGLINFN